MLWRRGNNKIRVPSATVAFLFHCRLRFPAANPPSHWCSLICCWYETLLVVFVWVLRSCLIIVSSCAFYGYWCECVVCFMLKNHILVCFLVIGLHLCLVVEVVYVHYLCLVVKHVCGKWFVVVFWASGFHVFILYWQQKHPYNRKIVVGFLFLVLFCGTFTRNYWTNHLGEHSEPLIWTELTTQCFHHSNKCVCSKSTHSEPLIWTEQTT